jgi:excisionase family DNA binding protein
MVDSWNEQLMSVGELAKWLNVSVSWVYKAVEAGTLPCFRIGARVLFRRKQIKAWLGRHHSPGSER